MKYIATGRVHPERADISFSTVNMRLQDGGLATASCDSSQITVVLDSTSADGYITAQMLADNIANIIVSALGFSLGSGSSVEIIQVTEESGTSHVFGVRPHSQPDNTTLAFGDHIDMFNKALQLAGKDVFFRFAIRDYLRAIRDVTDCAIYCYRAIEGLMGAFKIKSKENGWDSMHQALNTNREAIITKIKIFSDPIRHGNWAAARPTTGKQRWEMLLLTREILERYIAYAQKSI